MTNECDRATATKFATGIGRSWESHFGERLIGLYLIGSLAHGGFSAKYSDIDIALIAEEELTPGNLDLMRSKAAACSAALASKLSIFWTDRHFAVGRFPPLDLVDYIDHAVALMEREHLSPDRPTPLQIRSHLRTAFQDWSEQALRLSAMDELKIEDHKRYLRTLLYPARFFYSWETGAVASNDNAVEYLQARAPVGIDLMLIERALRCRNEGKDPGFLFQERWKLLQLCSACAQFLAAGTGPMS